MLAVSCGNTAEAVFDGSTINPLMCDACRAGRRQLESALLLFAMEVGFVAGPWTAAP